MLTLAACDPDAPSAVDAATGERPGAGAGAAAGAGASARPANTGDAEPSLASLVTALADRSASGGGAGTPASPAWPADLAFHPDALAESIELVAVLDDIAPARRDARRTTHVVVRRFDRLRVRAPSDARDIDVEGFGFRDVVRTSVAVTTGERDTGSASTEHRHRVERATLGLADASAQRLQVRDAWVERADSGGGCGTSGHRSGDGRAELDFLQDACPSATSAGPLVVTSSGTLDVSGTLEVDGERRQVGGLGWVRRAWGGLPGGGAVVFDRLLVELDGAGLVEVSRSKRRSGRGPRITSAGVRPPESGAAGDAPAVPDALDGAEWLDGTGDGTGDGAGVGVDTGDGSGDGEVPDRWRLRAQSAGIDIVLEPLLDVPVIGDAVGRAWRGAVIARGSHAGIGFLEYLPIDAEPAAVAPPAGSRP